VRVGGPGNLGSGLKETEMEVAFLDPSFSPALTWKAGLSTLQS
jgi:hypothetical protein